MTDDGRPDPDALLALASQEEKRKAGGRLRIFLGAAPGVGKTYSMLEAAQTRRAEGDDVVIGVAETHGRGETEALLTALEVIPRRQVKLGSVSVGEFDLDAALARKPGLLLVDELAHTNVTGSRHAKRWQDVQELLAHGIDVYTTLNVQHVESLNDVVAGITGVLVRETVPDALVENAESVILVDLPPEDLEKRLAEGKVYLPEQAELAARHFFRPDNLTALRELSLRLVADRVNSEVLVYRQGRQAGQDRAERATWPTRERILVCVGSSPTSARLVRAAKRMASGLKAPWHAVYVEKAGHEERRGSRRDAALANLDMAERLGAETVTLKGEDVARTIVDYARTRNVTRIIIGKPLRPRWMDLLLGSPVDELVRLSGDIDVHVISGEGARAGTPGRTAAPDRPGGPDGQSLRRYGLAALLMLVCTGVCFAMFGRFELSNLIMVYLLGNVVAAAACGRGPAALASVVGVSAFDFFFVPPRFTFAVSDTQYLVTFAVMLLVALVISHLTTRIRRQAQTALVRERQTARLYGLSRELAARRGADGILEVLGRHIADALACPVLALLPKVSGPAGPKDGLETRMALPPDREISAKDLSVARWVYENGRQAGRGTQTLPESSLTFHPLRGHKGVCGVVGLGPSAEGPDLTLTPDGRMLLDSYLGLTALALEVEVLADDVQRARLATETERMRSSLLSAVTHDLQTPLAAIMGSAGSLIAIGPDIAPATMRELAENIHGEAERLSRLLANLLRVARLESGTMRLHRELQPLEEIVGATLTRFAGQLEGREVAVDLPDDLPLIPLDSVLGEQLLVNLVENALKYSPPGAPLAIAARSREGAVEVEVADRGSGLPPEDMARMFEPFYRGRAEKRAPGYGLGLAICRAIVQVHGGVITAEARAGGGLSVRFTLPLGAADSPPDGLPDADPPSPPAPQDLDA